jgi:plastocyanin
MKIDITKLPIAEAVVAFLLAALGVTFILAFNEVDGSLGGAGAPSETPSPTAGGESPTPTGGGGSEFAITMGDNTFDPKEITVSAGATVKFSLTNSGVAIHNMRVAGEDNKFDSTDDAVSDPNLVTGGSTGTLEWTAPSSPGVIDFRCDFHPTDMNGKITVQ